MAGGTGAGRHERCHGTSLREKDAERFREDPEICPPPATVYIPAQTPVENVRQGVGYPGIIVD
jgi:hypothetical protein